MRAYLHALQPANALMRFMLPQIKIMLGKKIVVNYQFEIRKGRVWQPPLADWDTKLNDILEKIELLNSLLPRHLKMRYLTRL
jgi:hypothetical protein